VKALNFDTGDPVFSFSLGKLLFRVVSYFKKQRSEKLCNSRVKYVSVLRVRLSEIDAAPRFKPGAAAGYPSGEGRR
jgi:hypothetical protein